MTMLPDLLDTFDSTIGFMLRSVADIPDEQMVVQPAGVPNHAMWTLGHVTFSCQGLATEFGAKEWLEDDWESVYGYGSTALPDATRYPAKSEMLDALTDSAQRLRETLSAIDEATLKQPLPDDTMPTVSHLLLQVVVAHTAYHAGQLAVWRRAMGRQAAAVFV